MILNLYEQASSSNINFAKFQTLWAGTYKIRIDKAGQMVWSQFSIKTFGVYFLNSVLDNNNWDRINEKLTKKSYLEQRATLFVNKRNNRKPNAFIETLVHRSNTLFQNISKRKLKEKNIQFLPER